MRHDEESKAVSIAKDFSPALQLTTIERPSLTDYFLTAVPQQGQSPKELFQDIAEILRRHNAEIISQEAFGSLGGDGLVRLMLKDVFGQVDWPVTWIEARGHESFAGTQIWAASGAPVERVRLDGHAVGSLWRDDGADYCRLGGLHTTGDSMTRKAQATEFFTQLETALHAGGFEFANTVRTWFYLRDILSWYGEFNQARSAFYGRSGMLGNLVPASTGIGVTLPAAPIVTGGLLAMKPVTDGSARATRVASPLQCAAMNYGSLFSRAVELETSGLRRLYVSGTASIASEGHTTHVGNLDGQIARTLEVVLAILESRGMSWGDVVRGIVYIKDAASLPAWPGYCSAHNLPVMPLVTTHCDICREDLLFEVEVDAIRGA